MATNVNTRSCGKCGKCDIETTDLEDHVRFCVRYFPFFCYVCDTRCASEAAMVLHFRFKHPGTEKMICEQREEDKELEVERIMKESQPSDQETEGFWPSRASTPIENASAQSLSVFRAPQASGGQPEVILHVASLPSDPGSEAAAEKHVRIIQLSPAEAWGIVTDNLHNEIDHLKEKLRVTEVRIAHESRLNSEGIRGMRNQKDKKNWWVESAEKVRNMRNRRENLKQDIEMKQNILSAMGGLKDWAISSFDDSLELCCLELVDEYWKQ